MNCILFKELYKDIKLCDYGCENIGLFKLKNGKYCCSEKWDKCLKSRLKNRDRHLGEKNGMYGKKISEDTRNKMSISKKKKRKPLIGNNKIRVSQLRKGKKLTDEQKNKLKGKIPWNKGLKNCFSDNTCLKISIGNKGKHKNTEEFKEQMRQKCLNGHAIKMIKCIKKISNEELKLREMVKGIYSNCEFQHGVFNYSLDIALIEDKIAIEYDGYYHFNTEENKEYHKFRQKRIEEKGWKFIRYTMFDRFPTTEQIEQDINFYKGKNK